MYEAKILLDSRAPCGQRLTTWELTYPRFIHAELMTHRVFSRNSASSRAIPVAKLMERVRNHPVIPKFWGKNQTGMQAAAELDPSQIEVVRDLWLHGQQQMLQLSDDLSDVGLHKQIANRPLEAWMFITVVVSSTSFANWFKLRRHPAAQPEIQWLAGDMHSKYLASTPRELEAGEWHMPLLPDRHVLAAEGYGIEDLKKISVGRVARTSYLTHDGWREANKDLELFEKLSTSGHWSPFEHVAMAMTPLGWDLNVRAEMERAAGAGDLFNPMRLGNFLGWKQFRKEFFDESGFDFKYEEM